MDTRFWGPSGWKLLHIACASASKDAAAPFLETIPYILPCLFCRASLTDYYRQLPYAEAKDLPHWIYQIHNLVNGKLRKQGLHPTPNPSYAAVSAHMRDLLAAPWSTQLALFWDFLFAVGYHHPNHAAHTKPMEGCPPSASNASGCEQNKWNVLPWNKRMYWFRRFWSVLPDVLPTEIRKRWVTALHAHRPTLSTRRTTMAWLWRMRCSIDTDFRDPYASVCKRIAAYSSDCGTRRGSITCRKRRTRRAAHTVKTRTKE